MASEMKVRLRDRREPGHFWADNEIIDVFGDELGQNGISVYMTMTRFCYGAEVKLSLREIAAAARMSKDTVARSMKVLVTLGLVLESKGAKAKTVSTWSLANVKALVQSYVRQSVSQTVSHGDSLISDKTRESASVAAQSTLVQLVNRQQENCLTVRQMEKTGTEEDFATDLSQTEAGFETDLSQNGGPHLYCKTQDTKLQDTTPLPPSSPKGDRAFLKNGEPGCDDCDTWDGKAVCTMNCGPAVPCEAENGAKPRERSACAAVQLVKRECNWSDKRLDPVIEQALRQRCRTTGATNLRVCASTMVSGWKAYLENKHLLRYTVGERKFITGGWWIDDRAWPWDETLLREKRRL